jgi:LEA14-like dessication related protein
MAIGVLILSGKSLKDQLERVSVTNFRIQVGGFKLTEVLLKVTLDIYNPNSQALKFGYFQGYIYRNGIRLGRFVFNDDGKNTKFPARATTPATFNVNITTAGIVSNLFNILKNLKNQKPIDTTLMIDGIINIGGMDIPIKYSYDLKNAISGPAVIGKPYAKFEFNSNEEMASYLRRPCAEPKFSLNGSRKN